MARGGPSYRYWDSCAFLGWLKREPEKKHGCEAVIRAGEAIVVTSTLTIAEVPHTKSKERISVGDQNDVEAFFKHRWITTRGLDRATAEFARRLVWAYNVEPMDAVHVATALTAARVDRMDTTDDALIALSPLSAEGRGPLTIAQPEWPRDRTLDDELAEQEPGDDAES
jgi:PIN domain nuclease of toxin-antitoxin system